jgi:UDP-2-acetamido-2,6-beta-L-arabino-hexul-4-ose reductase
VSAHREAGAVKKIGITGIDGLIGWHLRCFLNECANIQVLPGNRARLATQTLLDEFVVGADAIVHLAGMNRGDDNEIETTNIALTEALISACEGTGRTPHIVFASSTHVARDTAYARSKRRCAQRLDEWAKRRGARFTTFVMPHVFGECGKPFYNSAVSTFCYQLANAQPPRIIQDSALELIHAQRVAESIFDVIENGHTGEVVIKGFPITVSDVLRKLGHFAQLYRDQIIPPIGTEIDLALFNTYRSYLYPTHYPVTVDRKTDERGSLFEAVRSLNGGQSFISTTKPGIVRGNHYHRRKVERFFVLDGKATIRIRKLFASEILEFVVCGDKPQYIDIPTLHTHNITNTGDTTLTTLFWAHEIFDAAHPDTYREQV